MAPEPPVETKLGLVVGDRDVADAGHATIHRISRRPANSPAMANPTEAAA
jgi:hypothetical protein